MFIVYDFSVVVVVMTKLVVRLIFIYYRCNYSSANTNWVIRLIAISSLLFFYKSSGSMEPAPKSEPYTSCVRVSLILYLIPLLFLRFSICQPTGLTDWRSGIRLWCATMSFGGRTHCDETRITFRSTECNRLPWRVITYTMSIKWQWSRLWHTWLQLDQK